MATFNRDSIVQTEDHEMQRILGTIENVAMSRATVLLLGESGTGKEVLAKLIHSKSPRATRRMVAINCAAVPDGLLESELFGHEKGAFTGAHLAKPGKFELAHESTLLLDEVSEMPLLLQAKLLRVIQEGEIERLGSRQPTKVNVRIVATANRDLANMVKLGQFREDLFYRLNVVPLRVPPLRERPRDIESLARFFVDVSTHTNGREQKPLAAATVAKLLAYRWPGNVRELENVMERAVLFSNSKSIEPEDIQIEALEFDSPEDKGAMVSAGTTVAQIEQMLILKTLQHTAQNRTQAAKLLGISIRTLRNKLHVYGVINE